MKSTLLTVFIAVLFGFNFAQAVSLKTETTAKTFENAKLVKAVTLQNDDKTEAQMTAVSHGLRKKAVFGLVPVSVYVMQVLAAKPEKLVKTEEGFLSSVKDAGPVQLHLTFLRNLPGEKISDSFKDGLEANKIDVKALSPELTQVLKEISAITEFKEGESFSITFAWTGDKATAYLTDSTLKIKTVAGNKEFADQLLSIWFGKTADGKLEELKKTLIK
ncbi:chalcone isomerase family protein [bacterium]|nr:chalcone isomerase family protein [bacterium]